MMQKRMFVDIETIADPEAIKLMPEPTAPGNLKDPDKIAAAIAEKKKDQINSAPLDPDYSRVLSIGYTTGIDQPIIVRVVGEVCFAEYDRTSEDPEHNIIEYYRTEEDVIREFWEILRQCGGCCVVFNGLAFDLPFMEARSMYLGIKIPIVPVLAKFRTEPVTDLYGIRYNWGPGKGLKQMAKLLGIENIAEGITGAMVKDLDISTLRQYQESDVRLLIALYQRMNGIYFKHNQPEPSDW